MKGCMKTRTNNYAHVVEELLGEKAGIFLNFIFIATIYLIISIYFIVLAGILVPILI